MASFPVVTSSLPMFSKMANEAPMCQLQPQDRRTPSLSPQDHHKGGVMLTAQMGSLKPARLAFLCSGLGQGKQASLVTRPCG